MQAHHAAFHDLVVHVINYCAATNTGRVPNLSLTCACREFLTSTTKLTSTAYSVVRKPASYTFCFTTLDRHQSVGCLHVMVFTAVLVSLEQHPYRLASASLKLQMWQH